MSNSRKADVFELEGAAFLSNERTHAMFSSRILNSTIALAGCAIAAAFAIAAPMSAGGTQAAMPTSEWRSLLDQRVVRAARHEPRMQRLVSADIVPLGQGGEGWG
jgi:hypothetical protein